MKTTKEERTTWREAAQWSTPDCFADNQARPVLLHPTALLRVLDDLDTLEKILMRRQKTLGDVLGDEALPDFLERMRGDVNAILTVTGLSPK